MPRIAIDGINAMWPQLVLCSVVLITLRLVYIYSNHKPLVLYKELIWLCFIMYTILLFELVTSTDYTAYGNNFIPFREMFRYSITSPDFYQNVIGNIVLFLPFGYFTSYFCKVNKFYVSLFIIAITSLTIEIIQSWIGRAFDVDDIMLNVLGGLGGYLIYKVSERFFRKVPTTYKNSVLINLVCLAIIIALVLIILGLYGVF